MNVLRTIALAFSMFSRIPMPKVAWTQQNMRFMPCAFPLVGLAIGLVLAGWFWLADVLGFGTLLFAVGLTLIPVAVSGGIHLDGWCDTLDALASHASPERRREILKDPHTGAFAVIGLAAYLLAYAGLCSELPRQGGTILLLGLMHILSRVLSGFSVVAFPAQGKPGLFTTFRESADKKPAAVLLIVLFALCSAGLLLADPAAGLAMVPAALICGLFVYFMSKRQFGGMSGDLAGYLLQLAELAMLASWVIVGRGLLGGVFAGVFS